MIPSIPPYRRIEAHLIHGVHERIQVVSGGDDGLKVLPPWRPLAAVWWGGNCRTAFGDGKSKRYTIDTIDETWWNNPGMDIHHTSYIIHHTSYIISIHVLSWTNQLGQPLCPNQTWLGKAAERWTPGIFHVAMGNPLMEDLMRQHWNTIYKWVIFDWNHTLWTVHTIWEWWIYCMFYAALHHIFIYTYAVNTCPAAFARAASAHRCPFSDVNGRSRFFPVLVGYSAVPPSWKWSNEVQKRPW